jgi:hypothetical protein
MGVSRPGTSGVVGATGKGVIRLREHNSGGGGNPGGTDRAKRGAAEAEDLGRHCRFR